MLPCRSLCVLLVALLLVLGAQIRGATIHSNAELFNHPSILHVSDAETYLVRGGLARLVTPVQIVQLCVGGPSLKWIDTTNASFHARFPPSAHRPMPSLQPNSGTPDEAMRVFSMQQALLQDADLVEEQWEMGAAAINPGVVVWRGQLISASANSWELPGRLYNDRIEFHPQGSPLLPAVPALAALLQAARGSSGDATAAHGGAGAGGGEGSAPMPRVDTSLLNSLDEHGLLGQDPRLLAVGSDALFVSFTWRFSTPVRMGVGLISLMPAPSAPSAAQGVAPASVQPVFSVVCRSLQPPSELPGGDEKNWIPFLHDGHAHFIHSINPLVVLRLPLALQTSAPANASAPRIEASCPTELVPSLRRHYSNLTWTHCAFGHLRGGSNAVFLPAQGVYLGLFHSSTIVKGNTMKTYFMGAYTFSPAPPFRLLSISPRPILRPEWTQGPWNHLKNRKIDYIVFPEGLSLIGPDTLLMSFGRQDSQGWLGRANLTRLLDSLERVAQGG